MVYVIQVCRQLSSRIGWNNWAATGRIFMKFDIGAFFEKKTVEKIQVLLKSGKNYGYFT
jgi:hypothetical protein